MVGNRNDAERGLAELVEQFHDGQASCPSGRRCRCPSAGVVHAVCATVVGDRMVRTSN